MPDQNSQGQVTFEQAIDSMHRTYPHMSHGDVLKQMQQWYNEGNPKVHSIPDVASHLKTSAIDGLVHAISGGPLGLPPSGLMGKPFTSVPKDPQAPITGAPKKLDAEGGRRFGVPTASEEALQQPLVDPTFAAPDVLSPVGLASNIFGQAVAGKAQEAVGELTPNPYVQGAAGIGAGILAGHGVGKALGNRVFGRSTEPIKSPFAKPVEPSVPPPKPPVEPIGSANIRAGRPFEVRTHVRMRSSRPGLDIWGDPRNPQFGEGPPYPAEFKKPLVLEVPNSGEEGWVHAATSLYADEPSTLEGLREAKDPVGMAQELVARKAKRGGFDSVNLSTPDVTNNVIMGIDDKWKPSPHPDITPETTRFQKKATKSPFAQAQPELGDQIASAREEPSPSGRGEAREKVRKSLIKRAKEPNPLFHAKGDPDLEKQIKHSGKIAGLEGTYEPETQRMINKVKERVVLTRYTMSRMASDHPLHDEMIMHTEAEEAAGESETDKLRKMYEDFRKETKDIYVKSEAARQTNHDELMRAVDGLEYDLEQKKWVQSALNVDSRFDQAARRFSAIKDRIYERDTGNDARAPYILERYGLSHARAQFERLRALQEQGKIVSVGQRPWSENPNKVYEDLRKKPPSPEEQFAAEDTKGMLKFDFTHDLDIEPFTGYLRFQAHANERAILESHIKQLKELSGKGTGIKFEDQVRLEEMLKRLNNIEARVQNEGLRRRPQQDFIPRKKWSYASHVAKDPEARPLFFETDPDKIVGNFIASHNNKRVADVALAYARRLINDQSGTVYGSLKDRVVDWANGVRGATQFAADSKFARQFNSMLKSFGVDANVSAGDMHKWTSLLLDLDRFMFLEISPLRFPFINLTHSTLTTFAVHPQEAMEAVGNVLTNPTKIFQEAMEAGVAGHDSEWAKEIGGQEPTLGGRVAKPVRDMLRLPTWFTENFRKVHAYETARIAASRGKFSSVIRGFVHDPKEFGGNVLQRQKAYQLAFTRTTQFNMSNVDKPIGFQGGPIKRGLTQFKTWTAGLAGFWSEAIRQKEYGILARSLAAAALWGGPRVLGPLGTYEFVRHEVLRNTGWNLWPGTGVGYIYSKLGMHDSEVDIPSLTDPLGTMMFANPGTIIGPALGSMVDTLTTVNKDVIAGKQYKLPQDLIRGLGGPQTQAILQAWEENARGGVFGPDGAFAMNRPKWAILMRGLDMQKSVQSQHRDYETDIGNAILSKDKQAVQGILDEAHRRGFVFDAKSQRRIRAFVREHIRGQARPWQYVQ